jgi:tRNA-dihydrouridine synthase B
MAKYLPWPENTKPLMLAPMQGLTNRALRGLFIRWVRPDVVFTEFLRVRPGSNKGLSRVNIAEVSGHDGHVPLVAQLIGRDLRALMAAAEEAQDCGVRHLNINMGCPFGRMTSRSAGGALLKDPAGLENMLTALRRVIQGSFSVKLRSGYDDPEQIFSLLPLFEDIGVDFLVLHPRTVIQRYAGRADHAITGRVVRSTRLPVIANGDVTTAAEGRDILHSTAAAGLMLGRGAIGDPMLFKRLRGDAAPHPSRRERAAELRYYLRELQTLYTEIFHGDTQVLCKLKGVLAYIGDQDFKKNIKELKRCKSLGNFAELVDGIA